VFLGHHPVGGGGIRGMSETELATCETQAISRMAFEDVFVVLPQNVGGILDPHLPDCHASDLCKYLSGTSNKLSELYSGDSVDSTEVHTINPRRLYQELNKADSLRDPSLTSKSVINAGMKVDAIVATEGESRYDEELTSGDYLHDAPATEKDLGATPWKICKRPNPASFYVQQGVWEQGLRALHRGKNVLLTGPSGCGKTELAHLLAKSLGLPTESVNMGATTEPRDVLIGTVEFDPKQGTHLCRSRFARFVGNPSGMVLLDEITRGGRDANNILLPLLDRQAYIAIDEEEGGAIVRRGDNMSIVATANIGMEYTGTEALDIALQQRFQVVIDLYFPPIEWESKVLQGRTGIDATSANVLCTIANQQRVLQDAGDFVANVSTRMLLEASELVVDGFDLLTACQYSILNNFSNDGDEASERSRILQIIQKHVG